MNDQLPDFEPPAPMFEDPKPKKDRKPRRKARRIMTVKPPQKVAKKRRAVKVKVIRRGRPAGSKNKPKYAPPPATRIPAAASNNTSFAAMMEIVRQIKALPPMDQQEIVQYLKDWL